MGKVVSVINWKGGVGKSTLTYHLGVGLAKFENKKILLIDLDPQCNLSFLALGVDKYVNQVYRNRVETLKNLFDSYFDDNEYNSANIIKNLLVNSSPGFVWSNVDMVLSHQDLVLVDLQLARTHKAGRDHKEETRNEIGKLSIIHNLLEEVKDDYDYILLDCPPNVNIVTQNAFYASDYYVIPAIPDFLSTTGISLIKDYMDNFNTSYKGMYEYSGMETTYNETQFGGILFNMVDEYNGGPKQTHQETITEVSTQHPGGVFTNYITDGDGISAAASVNLPVYSSEYLPRGNQNAQKQSAYLRNVVTEFISRIV